MRIVSRPVLAIAVMAIALHGSPVPAQTATDLADLRAELHDQISAGHQRIGYSATYDVLAVLYEDPDQPLNVLLFYADRSQRKTLRVNGDGRNGWNREHLWPQSHGTRAEPMKSDLHHLRPTDASINANRGNLDFDLGGSPEGEAPDTFLDGDSFEPRDGVKGDVARALFYMDIRYEGDGGEPDLVLVDRTTGQGTALGDLCTLLAWHGEDPPDAGEVARNARIEQIQGNRNPFVDDADLAFTVFGPSCPDTPRPDLAEDEPENRDAQGPAIVGDTPAATEDTPPASGPPQDDGLLRLATWNIANFWHVAGEHLRPAPDGGPGLRRTGQDYAEIAAAIAELAPDVIGLQEIASPESARRIFPHEDWVLVFSRRFDDDLAGNPGLLDGDLTRDIYTAVAVRRDRATVVGTERIELDILHEDGRPVREGIAALLDVDGTRFWAASVHLKSGCFSDNDLTGRDDCRTLARQIPILEDWIDAKSDAGLPVVLLGDFNRQLDRGADTVRSDLDDGEPVDLFKVPHRQRLVCSAFDSDPRVSIDYVILNEALWEFTRVPDVPTVDIARRAISDHCPVFVDLRLP